MKSLFVLESFRSHSGLLLNWKIDCDALTDDDLDCIAFIIDERFSPIGEVVGIPRGGVRLAEALRKYVCPGPGRGITLIVDDVLTTGGSFEAARVEYPGASGAVIFARGPSLNWVWPVFQTRKSGGKTMILIVVGTLLISLSLSYAVWLVLHDG